MIREKLSVQKRTVTGKKVKQLRKSGILPATLYGKKIKSESLQLNIKDFLKVYKKTGSTTLVDLLVDNDKDPRPVLIHVVQKNPVSGFYVHADFYQVDLKEKIKAAITVISTGEARAVSEKKGVLLHVLSEVEVEALPTDLPEHIEVNVGNLLEVDQAIYVKDLNVDKNKVTVLTDGEEIVFKIGPLVTKEMEEELKAEEAAKAAAETAQAETAAPEAGAEEQEEAAVPKEEVKKEE